MIVRQFTPNAGALDKPTVAIELLETGNYLVTFPRTGAPSAVVTQREISFVILMQGLSETELTNIAFLKREIQSEILTRLIPVPDIT